MKIDAEVVINHINELRATAQAGEVRTEVGKAFNDGYLLALSNITDLITTCAITEEALAKLRQIKGEA